MKFSIRSGIIDLVLLCSCVVSAFAGLDSTYAEPWRWAHFTTESGLPSNSVIGILETADGTVWAITHRGIAWFDGFQWIGGDAIKGLTGVFDTRAQLASGDSILFDSDKGWFIGTRNGFHALPASISGRTVLPFQNGSYLIVPYQEHSLYLFENGVRKLFEPSRNLTEGRTLYLYRTEGGSIWIFLVDGLYRWQGNDWKKMVDSRMLSGSAANVVENRHGSGLMASGITFGLWEWGGGSFLKHSTEKHDLVKAMDIGPNDEAIVVYVSGDVRFRQNGIWSSITLLHSEIKDILSVKFRPNGDLWVGTDHGLYLCHRSTSRWESFKHESPDRRNYISEILKTRDGALWLATSDGVEVYEPSPPSVADQKEIRDLSSPNVVIGNPENLKNRGTGLPIKALGSDNNGLWGQSRSGGERVYRHIPKILGTTLEVVTGLAEDDDGNVWISSGSSFEGAFRWDGKAWKHSPVCDSCGGIYVHKIRRDRHGRLWFLGLGRSANPDENQPGAFVYENGTFTRWGEVEGLPSGRVYAFAEGEGGTLWFGTYDGVSRWRPNNPQPLDSPSPSGRRGRGMRVSEGTWTHWTDADPSRKPRAFALDVNHEGRAWFGNFDVAGSGLGYIDEHDSIRYLTTADGLIGNRIWDIRVDSQDKLWIATENGISCYDHGAWTTYDERSGLSHSNIWPLLPLEDKVYIGTLGKGLTILDRTIGITPPPRVLIEKPIVEEQDAEVRWNPLSFWAEIAPAKILTRYRVNDGQWSGWSSDHGLKLHNGEPDDYRLQIQAKGAFGQFDPEGVAVNFTILPPLHLRPIFFVPVGVLAVSVLTLALVMHRRRRKHVREIKKSEAKFRAVTEMTSSGIFICTEDFSILFANAGFTWLTGYTKEELVGMNFVELLHSHSRESFPTKEKDRLADPSIPQREEMEILVKEDGRRWIDLTWGGITFQGIPAIIATAFDITERKHAEEELISKQRHLRALTTELSLTEERERRRVATYLHDTISQALLLTKIKLESLDDGSSESSIKKPLADVRTLIEQTIENTRTLTFELCPPILYDLGLTPAIDWLVEQVKQAHGLRVTFNDDRRPKPLSDAMRDTLYNGTREALMNVVKHARAKNVWVDIHRQGDEVIVAIEDDGVGFDPEATRTGHQKHDGGFGLMNLHDRITHLGGRMEIESCRGKGTRVTLAAPIQETSKSQSPNDK